MPQRFLRPGITNSERWNKCSFEAQSFWVRIVTLVDDFGRYDARISILHAHCFALRNDVNPQRTAALRCELQTNELIQVYEVKGKEYLQVLQWEERARAQKSKFPDPAVKPQDSAADRSVPQETAADGSGIPHSAASLVPRSSSLDPRPSILASTSSPPPTVPQGGRGEVLQFGQSKEFLNLVFGREKRSWSREEDGLLVEIGPIRCDDADLIRSWFGLPLEHPVFEKTKRKQELTTFLREFQGELDKMRRFAPLFQAGRNGSRKNDPSNWRECLRWLHGAGVHLSDHFDQMGGDLRDECRRNLPAFRESEPGKKLAWPSENGN